MKRRFPVYVFLFIAIISAFLVLLVALNFKIPPSTIELWMDLYSGRMEYRYSWWGVYQKTDRPVNEFINRLSQDYLTYIGPYPDETEWVMIYRYDRTKGQRELESYKYTGVGIEYGQRGISNWLKWAGRTDSKHETHRPKAGFANQAKKEVILRYLQVARTARDDAVLSEYAMALRGKLWSLDHPVEVSDLIDVDDFLSDPRRERYYDPETLE